MESDSGKPSDTLTVDVDGHGERPLQGLPDSMNAELSNHPNARPQWPAWLLQRGPVIPVTILSSDGSKSQKGVAHVDTGGRWTFIESRVVAALGLEDTGQTVSAILPGAGKTQCMTYDGKVSFDGRQFLRWRLASVSFARSDEPVGPHNTILVLGRDLLQFGRFEYDGGEGTFSLSLWIPSDAQPPEPS